MLQLTQLLADVNDLSTILKSFLGLWWGPLLGLVGAAGGILGIFAGVKYMLAQQTGDEQKIKAAKQFAIGIIIGIVIMIILAVVIPVLVAALGEWSEQQTVDLIRMII